MASFPDGFMWGTATAAHQVEGGNWNNDWWAWEHNPASPCAEPSGDACDHWHRYEEDLDLLAGFGFNSYRFSVEWSRIQPEDGQWSHVALDHYRRVCEACLARGLDPIVTYHHFTTPRWVAHLGGWEEPDTADRFAEFAGRVTERLGDVDGAGRAPSTSRTWSRRSATSSASFRPAGATRRCAAPSTTCSSTRTARAASAIKAGPGSFPVGLTLAMTDYQAGRRRRADGATASGATWRTCSSKRRAATTSSACRPTRGRASAPTATSAPEDGVPVVQMGYEFWPEALEATIRRA